MHGELGQGAILITAPNNMQVNQLQKRSGHKARIGTADPFQEQEAPVAISNSIETVQRLSRLCRLMDADSTTDGQEVGA